MYVLVFVLDKLVVVLFILRLDYIDRSTHHIVEAFHDRAAQSLTELAHKNSIQINTQAYV